MSIKKNHYSKADCQIIELKKFQENIPLVCLSDCPHHEHYDRCSKCGYEDFMITF